MDPPLVTESVAPGPVPMRHSGDWTLLVVCTAIVTAALVLSVRGEEQVLVPVVQQPLPGICTFKRVTGWNCPGCGLTRSFISLAHGDLRSAWQFNPASWYFFPLVVVQIPYRAWQLWRHYRGAQRWQPGAWTAALPIVLLVAVLGQWLIRLFVDI
ncbi:MAG: DUF2752 domain-containing protein [Planctomycetota bacterium]